MTTIIRITNDDTLVQHFTGVMIPVSDPFVGAYQVPGWKCLVCGWTIGSIGYPPSHHCPDEGIDQRDRRMIRREAAYFQSFASVGDDDE